MKRALRCCWMLVFLAVAGPASAQSKDNDAHEYEGFFLRVAVGSGLGGFWEDSIFGKASAGFQGTVNTGYAVAPDVVLFGGALWFSQTTETDAHKHSTGVGAMLGVTFWFGDASDKSMTVAVGGGGIGFVDQCPKSTCLESPYGPWQGAGFFQLAFGREWWVTESWGIGFAGEITTSIFQSPNESAPTSGTFLVSLSFSATFD